MADTKIQWTDKTWNPLRGCTKVSSGCQFCYAMGVAARFSGPGMPYEGLAKMVGGKPQWTNTIKLVYDKLDEPLHWKAPRMIFVNSMSDLFHPDVPDEYIERVFGVMAACPQHTFQVLTKRPERMLQWFTEEIPLTTREEMVAGWGAHHAKIVWDARGSNRWKYDAHLRPKDLKARRPWPGWPLPNVWLGTSIEGNDVAGRADFLRQVPAAVHFISAEPLLGPVDQVNLDGIEWVITGGESGRYHRPFNPQWAEDLRLRCAERGIAYFFKQVGGLTSHSGGDLLFGRQYHEYPRQVAP